MSRKQLPVIQMSALSNPTRLAFRPPQSAMNRWQRLAELSSRAPVLMKARTPVAEILASGYVGMGEITLRSIRDQLRTLGAGKEVRLVLNSPGGDAFEGIAIYNELREYRGTVTVAVRGMAASAASLIMMAGDRVEIGEAAMVMIHSASGMVMGNQADMKEFAELLSKIDQSAAELYARRTGMDVKEVLRLMQKETWMTAKEAVAKGFADVAVADESDDKSDDKKAKATASASPALVVPAGVLAASGKQHAPGMVTMSAFNSPGVAGLNLKDHSTMNYAERLAALREQRQAKMLRQGELHQLLNSDAASVTPEMRAEFDTIDTELVTLDDQLRITSYEARMAGAATAVTPARGGSGPTFSRGGPTIIMRGKDQDEKFPGQNFTRRIIANALAYSEMQQGRIVSAVDIADKRWGKTNPSLINLIRMAATPGAGSDSGEWGSELVQTDTRYTGDFLEYLYGLTVFDRLPLREIPANVTVKGTDGASTGFWVGQSKAIGVTSGSASSVALTPLKVGAIAVASNELLSDSSPSAELWIRNLLGEALAQRVDTTFLSAAAASAGVSPAGLLNGISALTSAGTSADNIRTDLEALAANFISNRNARNLWVVTSPGLGLAIKLMKNALGQPEFDGVTLEGGSIEGFRLLFGDNVGSGDVIMMKPDEIWKIGDTGVQVSFSRDATIEQQTDPSGATDTPTGVTTTNLTNTFQEDSIAIRLIRRINFQKRRTHAVAYVGDAGYGGVAS